MAKCSLLVAVSFAFAATATNAASDAALIAASQKMQDEAFTAPLDDSSDSTKKLDEAAEAAAKLITGLSSSPTSPAKTAAVSLPKVPVFLPTKSTEVKPYDATEGGAKGASTPTLGALPQSDQLQAPPPLLNDDEKMADSLEHEVTQMVLGKSGLGATPMGGSVQMISDLISKKMMPKVMAAHKSSQKELDMLMAAVHNCGKAKKIAFGGVNKQKKTYFKMSPLHKSCRGNEAVLFTESEACNEELKDKKTIKGLKCKDFAVVSKQVGDENAMRNIVKKAGSEQVGTYIARITATVCGGKNKKGGRKGGMLDKYNRVKRICEKATKAYLTQKKKCTKAAKDYKQKKSQCNTIQDKMDGAACSRAVLVKDACETYAECFKGKLGAYETAKKAVQAEEKDRKSEWRALSRMACLISSFKDGKVTDHEVLACKKKAHDTNHLIIKYPNMPEMHDCTVPMRFPATAEYKKAEFRPLPAMAKGKLGGNGCMGMAEINTRPNRGSPKTCKCKRVTLNGPYSPGPMVKCVNCLDARRSRDKNSCPEGTKLFAPRSRQDWKTVIASVDPLRNPHWIIDVTRPQNGCGGCTAVPMNSKVKKQKSWVTTDHAPWWLRSTRYNEPNGDYHANCFLDLWHKPTHENKVTWNDGSCGYHSKSYYCQPLSISTKPKPGSPKSCRCKKVELTGHYSAKMLLVCTSCLDVRRTTQKNSCPKGTKIFSPGTKKDWNTFLESAKPLRSPHWIIDITRPSNGCGGCTRHPMNSKVMSQATWRTSDGSPWWLRSTRYSEPNGDYKGNCYLDLWRTPQNSDSITWNDGNCNYHSNAYYCQPQNKKRASFKPKKR